MSSGQKRILDLKSGFGTYLDVISDNVVNNIYDNLNQKSDNSGANNYSFSKLANNKQRLFSEYADSNDGSFFRGTPARVEEVENIKTLVKNVESKSERQRLELEGKLNAALKDVNENAVSQMAKQIKVQQDIVEKQNKLFSRLAGLISNP